MTRDEIRSAVKQAKCVTCFDYTHYESDRCRNGGAYAYYLDYYRRNDGLWNAAYSTSAEYSYCNRCGVFSECSQCGNNNDVLGCTEPFDTISTEELIGIITGTDWEEGIIWDADGRTLLEGERRTNTDDEDDEDEDEPIALVTPEDLDRCIAELNAKACMNN